MAYESIVTCNTLKVVFYFSTARSSDTSLVQPVCRAAGIALSINRYIHQSYLFRFFFFFFTNPFAVNHCARDRRRMTARSVRCIELPIKHLKINYRPFLVTSEKFRAHSRGSVVSRIG